MSAGVGRLVDCFYTPDGRRQSSIMLAVHISTDEKIRVGQMQIIQKSFTDFHVKITDRPAPTPETFAFIETRLKKMIGEIIKINIEVVDEIPKEKSGKVRFLICEIDQPESSHR
jgi:phenylacetate-CoA ligase